MWPQFMTSATLDKNVAATLVKNVAHFLYEVLAGEGGILCLILMPSDAWLEEMMAAKFSLIACALGDAVVTLRK